MKRFFFVFLLTVILFSCATTGNKTGISLQEATNKAAKEIADELLPNSRVAIVAFESANDNLSEYIMEELNAELLKYKVTVVDRQNIQHIQQELNFQMSGYVNDTSAQSIGKFLGATAVITGQLIDLDAVYRYRVSVIYIEEGRRGMIIRHDVQKNQAMLSLINTFGNKR